MYRNFPGQIETLDPEKEYERYLKNKPIISTAKLPERLHISDRKKCPYLYKGYGTEIDENPMYRTVNSDYGYYSPNEYSIPIRNFPLSQRFSNDIYKHGMYRNFSLNTDQDKSFI